jgi:Ca2+/H+ antiporter
MRPYIFSLAPPDRWLGTILSTSIALLGLTGLLHQGRRAVMELRRFRFRTVTVENAFALSCLLVVAARFALYSQVEVEARFGLLLLAILALFVPTALTLWRQLNRRSKIFSAICFLLAIFHGCILSHWIQMHSEPIVRAWGT